MRRSKLGPSDSSVLAINFDQRYTELKSIAYVT